ncbi:hypothetical protein D8Y22_15670 [Salinadaptatus halalkaliphilus]|uniref:Pyrrolo-quinoline quinone repeat domain-containing protein n=1 Tax=Salinadaptatus halalkaliphilus TaxID=2419781 RepID=A0A4S3TID2_9EURY|nr:PQQ-binding-like beta-propeller repeat protein [Salinadaptatus halalkaliphilus]THE63779.1 hypothetical protein D8Y22_15670 [Salinadaptatus halalkaliphilus]
MSSNDTALSRRRLLSTIPTAVISSGCATMSDEQSSEFEPDYDRLRWEYSTDGRIPSRPLLSDGRLYFGSRDGKFRAIDAFTGSLEWSFATDDKITSNPILHAGSLFQ